MINSVTLNNGVDMPLLGLGTMQVKDIETILPQAIKLGYRLIDTAANYDNETEVGKGIRASQIDRSQLFITSKLKIQTNGYDGTMKAFNESLERLQLDYLDLYLIHQPYGDVLGEWRALEELYRQGKIKAIGVSNFAPFQLIDLIMHSDVKPAINQIEIHPFYQENRATVYNQRQSVQTEAWRHLVKCWGSYNNCQHLKALLKIIIKQWHRSSCAGCCNVTSSPFRVQATLTILKLI